MSSYFLENQIEQLNINALTRAPMGRGLILALLPISESTRPIFKIQAAFDSPAKISQRNLIVLTSESPMMSQIRSK